MKRMQGMLTGLLLGATAVSMYGMMNTSAQRKLQRRAADAGKRAVLFAHGLLDR